MREILKDHKLLKKLIKRRHDAILLIITNNRITEGWGAGIDKDLVASFWNDSGV